MNSLSEFFSPPSCPCFSATVTMALLDSTHLCFSNELPTGRRAFQSSRKERRKEQLKDEIVKIGHGTASAVKGKLHCLA